MSEAEIIKVLQKMKDKELADLIRSYLVKPSYLGLLLIFQKLGITLAEGKVNGIITTNMNYEERGLIFQQLGALIIDGLTYVLQIVYNPDLNEARIELVQQDSVVLQFINVGEKSED